MHQTAERSDIWLADQTPSAAHAPAVPNSVSINSGVTANRLIDCMAVSPSGAERWRRAFITNVEKANRTPATSPEPTAATMVRMRIVVLVMGTVKPTNAGRSMAQNRKNIRHRLGWDPMDAFGSLLDGPRARAAFLLRCVMEQPWSLRVNDGAPLTLVAVMRGVAWLVPDLGAPLRVREGDVAVVRGPDAYTLAGDHSTTPSI